MPWLHDLWRRLVQGGRLMVGVPDYDAYLAHRRAAHPDEPVMSVRDFHRNRIAHRYGSGPDTPPRCC